MLFGEPLLAYVCRNFYRKNANKTKNKQVATRHCSTIVSPFVDTGALALQAHAALSSLYSETKSSSEIL